MRLDALIAVRGGVGVAATAERAFSGSVGGKKKSLIAVNLAGLEKKPRTKVISNFSMIGLIQDDYHRRSRQTASIRLREGSFRLPEYVFNPLSGEEP